MRADRLVTIIILLQRYSVLTARDVARRLDVSERTILRDMDALSQAGVPVYAERGAHGGFRLVDGYHLDLSGLRTAELRTVWLGSHEAALADLGWQHDALSAQEKLQQAIPSAQRALTAEMRQKMYIDETPWFGPIRAHPALNTLQTAVWQDRHVAVVYAKADGSVSSRIISPYGLVSKIGVWYVVGEHESHLRVYRVSRIHEVLLQDTSFVRPASFDLREFWTAWTRNFETSRPVYAVRLGMPQALYHEFSQATPWPTLLEDHGSSMPPPPREAVVRVRFETAQEACRHLLGFGPDIRVLDPPELRVMITNRARQLWDSSPS